MTTINDGGSAFPREETSEPGMSLRDYFAGEALAALIACASNHGDLPHAGGSVDAYRYADAMIKQRST